MGYESELIDKTACDIEVVDRALTCLLEMRTREIREDVEFYLIEQIGVVCQLPVSVLGHDEQSDCGTVIMDPAVQRGRHIIHCH